MPPGTGICHQVNLEYLAQTVWTKTEGGETIAYPDTLVGTDSHTTMVNGLAVLGWGVGGIEAEAAMLGQPVSMLIPEVVGFKLTGKLPEGTTATDLVLTVTEMLRKKGVVGKFVEFYGAGPRQPVARGPGDDRQHGAGIWRDLRLLPDRRRNHQLSRSHRPRRLSAWRWSKPMPRRRACAATTRSPDPVFTDTLELDLATVEPSLAGPKRPQDRVALTDAAPTFAEAHRRHSRRSARIRRTMPKSSGEAASSTKARPASTTWPKSRIPVERLRLSARRRRCGHRRDHLAAPIPPIPRC